MSENTTNKNKYKIFRYVPAALLAAGLIIGVTVILSGYIMSHRLAAEIIKINKASEPLGFKDLRPAAGAKTETEDASTYYQQVIDDISPENFRQLTICRGSLEKYLLSADKEPAPEQLKQDASQLLTKSDLLLEKLDKASKVPYLGSGICFERSAQQCTAIIERIQIAASLLSLRTLNLVLSGKYDSATDSVISLLKMTRIIDANPMMIPYASKVILVNLACKDIQILLQRANLTEENLTELSMTLLETFPENQFVQMLLAERIYRIELARNLIPKATVTKFLQKDIPDIPNRLTLPKSFFGKIRIRYQAATYLKEMGWLIKQARRPWPEPVHSLIERVSKEKPKSDSLLVSSTQFAILTAQTLTSARCTALAVTIEKYRSRHGQLPQSPGELKPEFIEEIPTDPFTGKELLYLQNENGFTVYGTGIDGRDDSGSVTAEQDKKQIKDLGIRITPVQIK
jgi:hypothetical protein